MTLLVELSIKRQEWLDWFKNLGCRANPDTPLLFIQDDIDWPNIQNVGSENGVIFEDPIYCTYPECLCKTDLECNKVL